MNCSIATCAREADFVVDHVDGDLRYACATHATNMAEVGSEVVRLV